MFFPPQKAYKQSKIMSRCFLSKNPYLLTRAFSTYVRPILEYMLRLSGLLISVRILILLRKFSVASLKLVTIFVFCLTICALKDLIFSLSPFVTLTWIFTHATDCFIILLILTLFFLSLHAIIRSPAVILSL